MMLPRCLKLPWLLLLLLALPAVADHRRDFLLAESAFVAGAGHTYLSSRQDVAYRSRGRSWGAWEPGLFYSATEWLTLGAHSELGKRRGESLRYEATEVGAQVRLTPRPMALALGARLAYAHPRDSDEDGYMGVSGIVSYAADDWLYSFNLNYGRETAAGFEETWRYGAGIQGQVSRRVAYGLEAQGTLRRRGSLELMAGAYLDPQPGWSVHLGLGTGIIRGPGLSLRSEIIYRLR